MNRTLRIVSLLLMSVAAVSAVDPVRAADIGTAFTYQGSLENGGCPVTDTCNFEFSLWDGPDAVSPCDTGMQIGSTDSVPGVMVTGGIFTVIVDFGVNAFEGSARWLQISVQCPGDMGLTPLCPRQELTPSPYSQRAHTGVGTVNALNVTSNDDIGIGTTTPQAKLHVSGDEGRPVFLATNDGRVGIGRDPGTPDFSLQNARGLMVYGDTPVELNLVGSETQGNSGLASIVFHNTHSTEPKKRVASVVAAVSDSNSAHLDFNTFDGPGANQPTRMRIARDGNVGIGTTNPDARLELAADIAGETALLIRNTSTAKNDGNAITYFDALSGFTRFQVDGGGHIHGYDSSGQTVYITNGGGPNYINSGNFGIGTTNPSDKLHVCGNIRASGSINANGGCDVAEAFELSEREKIEPGMVMVLDADRPGHLRISTRAYDTKVAGIVSGAKGTRPGILLGGSEPRASTGAEVSGPERFIGHRESAQAEACDSPSVATADTAVAHTDLPVALSGRVYCLVDATKRAVKVGDLLTTSDTPGYAMKVTNFRKSQGAVLGKAMEPLAKGEKGLILVLVGLQ